MAKGTRTVAARGPQFEVDTQLFRELGELLVGRDSTALIELIKNAYDADATTVSIHGEQLDDPQRGVIVVSDNGTGMTTDEFRRGFLTIAGRSKTAGDRRSPVFRRRYTGEKGVGRLAAHKLARLVRIVSRKAAGTDRDALGFPTRRGVRASIDWDRVEAQPTLSAVAKTNAVVVQPLTLLRRTRAGTELRLERLRRRWTARDLDRFFVEVATLTPLAYLTAPLERSVVRRRLLFDGATVRDQLNDAGFDVQFTGALRPGEGEIPSSAARADWILEIECDSAARLVRIVVSPSVGTTTEYSTAQGFALERPYRADAPNVGFQARILQQSNQAWPVAVQGVRVYCEGFRVLPYGDPRDDWLELERDYRSRARTELPRLKRYSDWDLPPGNEQEGLVIQGYAQYSGAVFLTRNGATGMEMLVNREGFLPGDELDFVAEITRLGIDLLTRVRYAITAPVKGARRETVERQRKAAARASTGQPPTAFLVNTLQTNALREVQEARAAIAAGNPQGAAVRLRSVERSIDEVAKLSEESASEASLYRIVASMGLEQAAFIHEVSALALTAQTIARTLEQLAQSTTDRTMRRRLDVVAADMREMRERLRRNSVYLADMTGVEGRKRRSRLSARERLETVINFFARAAAAREVTIENSIPADVQTPPIFPAEFTALMSNLLSNAIKFAGPNGRVQASGRRDGGDVVIRVENTGDRVALAGSDRWFEPFRSTSVDVDQRLGAGMGLGLTITRSIVDEYGGRIAFVAPSRGFSTAIEIRLPAR